MYNLKPYKLLSEKIMHNMNYITPDLVTILHHLDQLKSDAQPLWGTMSAQEMVEHLTDGVKMSYGKLIIPLEIKEDQIEKAQGFLDSEHPFPKEFKAAFVPKEITLRHEELELAIDEFTMEWVDYLDYYEENPTAKHLHPYFGELTFDQWQRLQSKHITHHLTQFGIPISEEEVA